MHGCGAASSEGSFQATCQGTIYRQKSPKGRGGLRRGCDLLVVEAAQRARVGCSEKTRSSREGGPETELGKAQKQRLWG